MKRSMAASEAKALKRNCFGFSGCVSDIGRFWQPNALTIDTLADIPPDVSLNRRALTRGLAIAKVDQNTASAASTRSESSVDISVDSEIICWSSQDGGLNLGVRPGASNAIKRVPQHSTVNDLPIFWADNDNIQQYLLHLTLLDNGFQCMQHLVTLK